MKPGQETPDMKLFVDTSVWSLALRRDAPPDHPAVDRLGHALASGDHVFCTGLILQELLQGFRGPRDATSIVERFSAIPFITPTRTDHVEAANLRNACRRRGVHVGTVDALLASCRETDSCDARSVTLQPRGHGVG